MNRIITELEKDAHERLLHEEMEAYTDCLTVDKEKLLTLFNNDIDKLNLKLGKAKEYHQNSVNDID